MWPNVVKENQDGFLGSRVDISDMFRFIIDQRIKKPTNAPPQPKNHCKICPLMTHTFHTPSPRPPTHHHRPRKQYCTAPRFL